MVRGVLQRCWGKIYRKQWIGGFNWIQQKMHFGLFLNKLNI
jgi:hypothetical protein